MCHVIVCPDCTLLPAPTSGVEPVFCVELKPKQGFLSQGHQHCPFCLNQFLKVPFSLLAKYGTLSRDGNNRERERGDCFLSPHCYFDFSCSGSTERSSCSASTAPSISFQGTTPINYIFFFSINNLFDLTDRL